MKRLIGLLLLGSALTGCGVAENIGQDCGGELKELCHNVFGGRTDNRQNDDLDDHQREIDDLKRRVSDLEVEMATAISQINVNQAQIDANTLSIASHDASITNLQGQIDVINALLPSLDDTAAIAALQASVTTMNSQIVSLQGDVTTLDTRVDLLESQIGTPVTGLQSIVTNNTIQITQLMNNHNVTKIVDPCGNGPGFDEIFLRTSSGKLIASFSQNSSGLNTRFSELTPGSYATTDGTGCSFTVNADLSITSSPAAVEY